MKKWRVFPNYGGWEGLKVRMTTGPGGLKGLTGTSLFGEVEKKVDSSQFRTPPQGTKGGVKKDG